MSGRTESAFKRFFAYALAVALFAAVAFLFAASFAAVTGIAYAVEEQSETEQSLVEYEFSAASVAGVRSETGAAIYFTQSVDESVKFKCVFEDESETVQESPYFFGLSGEDEVRIFVVRDEDEVYAAFETEIALIEVADKLVRLPDGQKVFYSGYEPSGVDEDNEDVTFNFEDGDGTGLSDVKNAGEYFVRLEYAAEDGESVKIRAVYEIMPLDVTVRAVNMNRKYKEAFGDRYKKTITIDKTLSDEDENYIKENTEVKFEDGVDLDTPVGQYAIYVTYSGDDPNFNVTTVDGVLTINPARLYGFTLEKIDVKYDGKAHRPGLKYDESVWADFTTVYNYESVTEIGEYKFTVVVKKTNYEDLELSTDVVIRGEYLESSSLTNYVRLSGNKDWYPPNVKIYLEKSNVRGIEDAVTKELVSNEKVKEDIIASYDVMLEYRGFAFIVYDDVCNLKIKLNGLDSAAGVRILQYDGYNLEEVEFTFENGYFLFTTNSLDGLVFVKSFPVARSRASTLIPSVLIGAVVVILIVAVLGATFITSGKERRRSRKRHSRWA